MTLERSAFADIIWSQKYRAEGEKTVEDTYKRVAKALSCEDATFERELLQQLKENKFIPAGRIFASAGLEGKYTLFNCFTSSVIEDSMEGIFEAVKEGAITQKYGGGIGFDFSTLRPSGANVGNSSSPASGPVSFMRVFDTMCSTVMSGNSRRGAMMGVLRCDHPSIIDFIHSKGRNEFIDKVEDPKVRSELYARFGALRNFNISVAVTDAFMDAVAGNKNWDLKFDGTIYKTIPARELWDILMKSTYETSEPGVIFIDKVNEKNNLYYCEDINCVNPCGEQPLPPSGNCNLGAINLTKFIDNPFTDRASIDYNALKETIKCAVTALDNVIDVSKYPLDAQEEEGKNKRRIGLGIMGLGTVFQMMKMRYGSDRSIDITDSLMSFISNAAYKCSSILALTRGNFPAYSKNNFDDARFINESLEGATASLIYKNGIRNGVLLTVAPTGTTALAFGDNCTSGLEPAFSLSYIRNVRVDGEDSYKSYDIEDYGTRLFKKMFPNIELPDYITNSTVDKLTVDDHLNIQCSVQNYIDASVSKTINLPADYSFEDFKEVYLKAYRNGCKGCTTYRPSDVRGSILEVKPEKKEVVATVPTVQTDKRAPVLDSKTYYIPSWPDDGCSRYVTIADKDGKPWEIFVATKSPNANAETIALARIISALFRRTDDVSFIADVLKEVHSPTGGYWIYGNYVPSLPAAYGLVLDAHIGRSEPFWEDKKKEKESIKVEIITENNSNTTVGKLCPSCLNYTLITRNGCSECTQCGYTKCG